MAVNRHPPVEVVRNGSIEGIKSASMVSSRSALSRRAAHRVPPHNSLKFAGAAQFPAQI
jgi:hypothetical protein